MTIGGVQRAAILLVPVALAGLAGCSGGSSTGSSTGSAATKSPAATGPAATGPASTGPATPASDASLRGLISAAKLKNALLTRVNGVASVAPATTGAYNAIAPSSTGKQATSTVVVTPKACASGLQTGFNATPLTGHPAASGSAALAGHVPAECARYQETADGKTFTYGVQETAVSGIGQQAKALQVQTSESSTEKLWTLIYRGQGFVGTVTVVGPNASEKAVRELGQQAYTLAAKSLS